MPYDSAKILVCGDNFGCGSSRECAVWGLMQLGIRAIIAPSIAGIVFGNCEMNSLLAITLPDDEVAMLLARVANPDSATLTIDLPSQTIEAPGMMALSFSIGEARKHNLIADVDHVGQALGWAEDIRYFEAQQNDARPWMWSRGRSM